MTHRRHIRRPTKIEKDRMSARFFQGPKKCDHCGEEVPRSTGDNYVIKGIVRWVCKRHVAEGTV